MDARTIRTDSRGGGRFLRSIRRSAQSRRSTLRPVVRSSSTWAATTFVADMARRLGGRNFDSEIPIVQQSPSPADPGRDSFCGCRRMERSGERAFSPRGRANRSRRDLPGHHGSRASPTREIGAAFGVKRGRVSNVVSEVDRGRHMPLRERLRPLESILKTATGHVRKLLTHSEFRSKVVRWRPDPITVR